MSEERILFVGLGNLGSQIFDQLLRVPGTHTFLVGGRNIDILQQRTNLSLFAAMQLGFTSQVSCTYLDLWDIERTAATIAHFQPDIIVCAATLQQTEAIHDLPQPIAAQLAAAQLGPRLPLHLCLVYKLMQAVKLSEQTSIVINAVYPDVVGPVLQKVGLAPSTGVGDLANHIPALRQAIAWSLGKSVSQVDVSLVMPHYLSYGLSRKWQSDDAPFHLTVFIDGEDQTHLLDVPSLFSLLSTKFKRTGGISGLLMTASSTALVFDGIVNNTGIKTHAPGPNGFIGGYPVKVCSQGVEVLLPPTLSLENAIRINEAGLPFDGIEKIENDGTVYFTEKNMAILKDLLGYDCRRMPLSEVEDRARELQAKYYALASKY